MTANDDTAVYLALARYDDRCNTHSCLGGSMVAQRLVSQPAPTDATLSALWRATALRLARSGIIALVGLGLAAITTSLVASRWPILAAVGIVVASFAAYAALIQPHGSEPPSHARYHLATAVSALAAVAAFGAGLLILAAMFGGSIEVMRR